MLFLRTKLPLLIASVIPAIAMAQTAQPGPPGLVMIQPPTPDADALAAEMRVLAENSQDLNALIGAGELTLKLGDPTASAAFLTRAEKVDPNDPRLKAAMGRLLVRSEQPGAALQRFAEAEAGGDPVAAFAADRALAYDLIGEQERAQRDYRLALKAGPDDDVTRDYALSLAISGQGERALAMVDPLVRKGDRGAWRARAFILAMNGDSAGAEKIAADMMPGNLGVGLDGFFVRLRALGPIDRAFAVHFGEIRATPQRLADARLAPTLGPLLPDPDALAMAETSREVGESDRDAKKRKKDKKHGRQAPVEIAAATITPPVAIRVAAPPPPPPPPPAVLPQVQTAPATAPPPESNVRVTTRPQPVTTPPVAVAASAPPAILPSQPATSPPPATVSAAPPQIIEKVPLPASDVPREPALTPSSPTTQAADNPATALPPPADSGVHPRPRVGREDDILATIVANISIPGSELGVTDPDAAQPVAAPPPPPPPPVAVKASEPVKATPEKPAENAAAVAAKKAADEKEAARKAAADKKAAAKAAADKKAATEKAAADRAQAAQEKANPARIWVQVAGGANEDTLVKAWAAAKAKAPDLFHARTGWTTPLRATNRVLAGPFKTSDDAQDFVNKLIHAGLSGFVFQSDKGQVITKLESK
jgi:Flp pilus assembly protein TadD